MELFDILFYASAIGAGVVITVGILLIMGIDRKSARNHENAKKRFFQQLDARWELDLIKELKNIVSLVHAISRTEESVSFESTEISDLLDEYLLKMTSGNVEEINKDKFSFMNKLLDEQRIEEPFSILPDRERRFAVALRKSIENNSKDDALQQLDELVNSTGTRLNTAEEGMRKNRFWTRASVLIGIGAVIITIFLSFAFGQFR